MAGKNRRAGIIQVKYDGKILDAKGSFTYNLGKNKRDAIVGSDKVHGFMEKPQVAFIEGEITDKGSLDLEEIVTLEDVTVTINLNNGKTIVLKDAWYAAEGDAQTEEANIQVRFESSEDGEEINP